MIPYLYVPPLLLPLGSVTLTLQPFAVLVLAAIWLGVLLTLRRGRRLGMDLREVDSYVWWMLCAAFLGSRALQATAYGSGWWKEPWSLLFVWEGMSSLGGFAGALAGGLLWTRLELRPWRGSGLGAWLLVPRRRPTPIALLPYADLTSSVFPLAWILGRAGCAIAHDHPGVAAPPSSWFAVAYGPAQRVLTWGSVELRWGSTPRYDLGLLELLFTVALSAALVALWGRRLPTGSYVAVCCLVYPPVRFALDFLRASGTPGADPRFGGLTPAQWGCLAMFTVGLMVWRRMRAQAALNRPSHG